MSKVFDTALLIAEVRKRPGLYDKNLDVDRDEKLALWKDIGAAVYRDWSSITKAVAYDRELQRKWRSVRDALNREMRLRRQGKMENRKQYLYFKQLRFLTNEDGLDDDDHEDGSNRDYDEATPSEDNTEPVESDPLQTQKKNKTKTGRKKSTVKRKISKDERIEFEMPLISMETANQEEEDKDSDRLFLLSFAQEMGKLPSHIKMWARAQIANIMQQAVSCHYNNSIPDGHVLDDQDQLEVKRQKLSGPDEPVV